MEVLKKVLNIIIDIFIILVVIVSAVIAIISVTARDSGVANLFGYVPFSVQSNSMSPVFEAGDLIVGKRVDREKNDYQVGDIITFWAETLDENGRTVSFLNTHRIVGLQDPAKTGDYIIITKGDNNDNEDNSFVVHQNVMAIWSEQGKDDGIRIQKLGSVLDFLRKPAGFFVAVVLPMAIFFIYELVRFITNLMNYNKEKAKEAALEAAKEMMGDSSSDSSGLSEEQKAQAILEYLEKQKAEQADAPPLESDNAAEETEQPASEEATEAVIEPEQEQAVSEASED